MRSLLIRIVFSTALVAAIGLTVGAASAAEMPGGPTLEVANPAAGDMITPGALVIQGVAFDPTATTGTGVDRVSVFLDDRDGGGFFLGDATLGVPNVMGSQPAQFANAGWTLLTPALKGTGDSHMLCVYARSSVTGQESEMEIPVSIGQTTRTNVPANHVETQPGASYGSVSDNPPNEGGS